MEEQEKQKQKTPARRAVIEVGFIIFLFYSNLLMGEYTSSGSGRRNGLWWSFQDIFTVANFTIAVGSAILGHLVFEFVRRKF
jgi:hypothetical protein